MMLKTFILLVCVSMASADFKIYNDCPKPVLVGQMTLDSYLNCNVRPKTIPKKGFVTIKTEDFSEIYFFARGAPKVLNTKTGECKPINQWTVDSLVKDHAGNADEKCYTPMFYMRTYNLIDADMRLCCE
jgi:hypothetical protein